MFHALACNVAELFWPFDYFGIYLVFNFGKLLIFSFSQVFH